MLSTPVVDEIGFYILTSPFGMIAEILVASFGVQVGASNDLLSVPAIMAPDHPIPCTPEGERGSAGLLGFPSASDDLGPAGRRLEDRREESMRWLALLCSVDASSGPLAVGSIDRGRRHP